MIERVKFNDQGLAPTIVQDVHTGKVLMLAYTNREALQKTQETGDAWFYSRTRQELWHKGETSGNFLRVHKIIADCDADTILLQVEPTGPVCHTGAPDCFYQELTTSGLEPLESGDALTWGGQHIVDELFQVILERQRTQPEGSYVASLLKQGIDRVAKKVIEEAGEAVIAAKNGQPSEIAYEVADLWFHSLVLLAAKGMTPEAVWQELRSRRK